MGVTIQMVGRVFERLTVLEQIGVKRYKTHTDTIWQCRCSCGAVVPALGYLLRTGGKTSCGCKRIEELGARRRTHGKTKTPEYKTWGYMHARCRNPKNRHYASYGGRGIRVCDAWTGPDGFEAFLAAVGPRPGKTYTLDRINVDGDYEPGNVRWATPTEQMRNKRNTQTVTLNGVTQCVSAWAEQLGISRHTIRHRLVNGYPPEQILSLTPLTKKAKIRG